MYSCSTELFEIELIICIKMYLVLNNQQRLIYHKTQPTIFSSSFLLEFLLLFFLSVYNLTTLLLAFKIAASSFLIIFIFNAPSLTPRCSSYWKGSLWVVNITTKFFISNFFLSCRLGLENMPTASLQAEG